MNQFDQNPFQDLMNAPFGQQGAAAAAQTSPQTQTPMMGGMGGKSMMKVPAEQQDITQPGVTGDNTKPLLSAVQSLHSFIGSTTDPQKIQVVRIIISLITQLVQQEQENAPTQVGS